MCALMLISKNMCVIFILKYATRLRITSTMAKSSASRGWIWSYFIKTLIFLCPTGNLTYRHGIKHNNLITINCGTYFCVFGIFHSKPIIPLKLCLVLVNGLFLSVFIKWFIVNYPVNMKNDYLYVFSGIIFVPEC